MLKNSDDKKRKALAELSKHKTPKAIAIKAYGLKLLEEMVQEQLIVVPDDLWADLVIVIEKGFTFLESE